MSIVSVSYVVEYCYRYGDGSGSAWAVSDEFSDYDEALDHAERRLSGDVFNWRILLVESQIVKEKHPQP